MSCVKILGYGYNNTVVELIQENDKYYVNKKIPVEICTMMDGTTLINGETLVMNLDPHPNLVKINGISFDVLQKVYCINMEYMDGYRELYSIIITNYTFSNLQIDDICKQLAYVLDYLHEDNNLIHSDIKTENILINLETNNIKLIDYGFIQEKHKKNKIPIGTMGYMAPELLILINGSVYYDEKIDIWSFGVSLYCIINKLMLFDTSKQNCKMLLNKYSDNCNKIQHIKCKSPWTEKSLFIFKQCMKMNPSERWSAKKIYEYMISDYNLYCFFIHFWSAYIF